MPQIHVVERDYKTIYDKMTSLGCGKTTDWYERDFLSAEKSMSN